jgi:DivIVA domain-containing protein
MSDHAFHLTSHDVRAQEFQKVLRGYDPTQVDEFKQRLAEEIDRLIRERVQLDERVRSMSEQLKSYRDRERAMNDALVSAQQLRTEAQQQIARERELALREAQAEGERVMRDATVEADRVLAHVRSEEQRLRQANDAARLQFHGYVAGLRQLLERQLAELSALDEAAATRASRGEGG